MRYMLLALPLLVAVSVPAHAADTADEFAVKVYRAYDTGEMDRLLEMASDRMQDPWLVADALCLRGHHDAAIAYARASQRPDTTSLPAYLRKRRKAGHNTALRAALAPAGKARTAEESGAVLEALNAQRDRGDELERAYVHMFRAAMLATLKRPMEAAEAFTAAGRRSEHIGWLSNAAFVYEQAGHQARSARDLSEMLAAWSRLLTVEEGRGHRRGEGRAAVLLGNAHIEIGDLERAVQFFGRADAIFTEEKDAARLAWALDSLGHVLQQRGDYSQAQAALQRGLESARTAKHAHRIAQILSNLGNLHARLHDFERSLEFHRESLGIFTKRNFAKGIAQCVGNIGNVYGKLGDFDKARDHVQRALDAYREMGDTSQVVVGLVSLAAIQSAQAQHALAKASLDEALVLVREKRDEFLEAHVLHAFAPVYVGLKTPAAAEEGLTQAMRIAARLASPRLQLETYLHQATVWYAQKKYERALHACERATELTMSQLVGLAPDLAAVARDSLAELFKVYLQAAVGTGRPGAVFAAMEAARAGAMLESLENRSAILGERVPAKLREEERAAGADLKAAGRAYRRVQARGKPQSVRRAKHELERASRQLQDVIGRIQSEAREAASVLYPVAASLDEAKALLSPGDALLSYSLAADPPIALIVTATGARFVELRPRDEIKQAAGASLDDPNEETTEVEARLRRLLVEPLKLAAATKRLLIAPDGVLGYVPFAVLVPDRDVTYVGSATTLRELRASPGRGGRGVLAVGDPDYRAKSAGAEGALQRGGMRLVPLPATRDEVIAIVKGVGGTALLGDKATPGRFLLSARTQERWRALHFACHGLLHVSRPMQSALALSFPKDGSNLLTCGQVFQQHLPTDIAVLSACETGRGKIHRVEGIVGLTQAFMVAGASRVLVSLWKVDDAATKALMIEFYKRWNPPDRAKAPSAAHALREAQAAIRKQEKWKHPYYWAAWVLWGRAD